MKKRLFFSLLIALCMISAMSQTVIFEDDFESYNSGDKLVLTTTLSEWTTWSNAPGGAEDPLITDEVVSQGSLSSKIVVNNDLVLHLGDLTTGRYKVSFEIFPDTGKAAYFNLLNNFNGSNSIWAFQVFFNADGTGTVDAGGTESASFTYTNGSWNNVNIIVDVDDDFATFYLNGTEVVSWVFSTGALGAGTLHKFDAINFFGHTNNTYYIDTLVVYEQPPISGPMNLQAVINAGDIDLTWDAPSGPAPDSYVIVANNSILATGVTTTSYTHLAPYPRDYTYTVKAYYDQLGYSQQSNDTTVTITGGVTRNMVLIEEGTGTWCPYCPGAAMGLETLYDEGSDVAIIAYHEGDAYETPESLNRLSYYNITSFPTVAFDGGNLISGGSATQSMYPSYKPVYDSRILVPSLHSMTMNVEQTGSNTFTASVDIEQFSDYYPGPFKLYGVLTESSIMVNWQNQNHLDFVFRKIHPSTAGINVDFSGSSTFSTTINFTIEPSWVKDNCEFIVFIQYPTNKEIVQAAKVHIADVISVPEYGQNECVVRPNPASEFVSIYADNMKSVSVITLTGQLVMGKDVSGNEVHMGIEHLPPGMYLVRIESAGHIFTRKLIIE